MFAGIVLLPQNDRGLIVVYEDGDIKVKTEAEIRPLLAAKNTAAAWGKADAWSAITRFVQTHKEQMQLKPSSRATTLIQKATGALR